MARHVHQLHLVASVVATVGSTLARLPPPDIDFFYLIDRFLFLETFAGTGYAYVYVGDFVDGDLVAQSAQGAPPLDLNSPVYVSQGKQMIVNWVNLTAGTPATVNAFGNLWTYREAAEENRRLRRRRYLPRFGGED